MTRVYQSSTGRKACHAQALNEGHLTWKLSQVTWIFSPSSLSTLSLSSCDAKPSMRRASRYMNLPSALAALRKPRLTLCTAALQQRPFNISSLIIDFHLIIATVAQELCVRACMHARIDAHMRCGTG